MTIHLGIYPYCFMPKVVSAWTKPRCGDHILFERKEEKKVRCILINTTNYYY